MANTFELIYAANVGAGGASDITFNTIPSGYTDLCLKVSARTSEAQAYGSIQFKINGAATGKTIALQGAGTGTPSSFPDASNMVSLMNGNSSTSNTFASAEFYIPNYTASAYKAISSDLVTENNATEAYTRLVAHLWQSTSAITSVAIAPTGGNTFLQYSTAYLYGVKNA